MKGTPEVFVIAGCGTGTSVFRRLQREGIPFATGILYENDLDFPVAKALASEIISVKPFTAISGDDLRRAKEIRRGCRKVICTLDPDQCGSVGKMLKELL